MILSKTRIRGDTIAKTLFFVSYSILKANIFKELERRKI